MLSLVKNTEWSQLSDYVSPTFFKVLPASALGSRVTRLSRNALRGKSFADAWQAAFAAWEANAAGKVLDERGDGALDLQELSDTQRVEVGQRVLELYFTQIEANDTIVLDLTPSRFSWSPAGVSWSPGRLWATWDGGFRNDVRKLYRGFYAGDDTAFDDALGSLQLEHARETFVSHFGAGDQSQVEFDTSAFHATFHEVFVRTREAGVRLAPDFVYLGIYLGTLYENLESIGGTHNVRRAYQKVIGARS